MIRQNRKTQSIKRSYSQNRVMHLKKGKKNSAGIALIIAVVFVFIVAINPMRLVSTNYLQILKDILGF
jgi:hypothetical protein